MKPDTSFEGISVSFIDSLPTKALILDYGCGSGMVSRFLVHRGFRVVAVDIGPEYEMALRHGLSNAENNLLTFYTIADLNFLSLAERNNFDCIICREVLEHVADPAAVLGFFYKCLAEGGRLVLSVPTYWSECYFSFCDPNWLNKSGHVRIFNKKKLLGQLIANKFFCLKKSGQSFRWTLFWVMLAPFRVMHVMGNPTSHGFLVRMARMATEKIYLLPGLLRAGNRFLPKSDFYYAVKRKPRVLIVYDYSDWILGKWAETIRIIHGDLFDIVTISMFHASSDRAYVAKLVKKVDIIHLLLPHAYDIFRDLARGKALVITIHHWVEWNDFYKRAAFAADTVVTVAQDWKNRLVGKGLSSDRITVVYNGALDVYFSEHLPLLAKNSKFNCGFFAKRDSNEFDRKGVRHLLALIEQIVETGLQDNFRFLISGPGWVEHVDLIRGKGIEIEYFEYVRDDDMPSLYRSLDVYLMLSDSEGGPVTIVEAMASECLVFSTAVGMAREIITDGVTGIIVDTRDMSDILTKLIYYNAHPEQLLTITDHARQFVLNNMRLTQTMLPVRTVYDDVLQQVKRCGTGDLDTANENRNNIEQAAQVQYMATVQKR